MFIWYAIILTAAYLIYYTVMIMNDLYGKKSEERSNTEEIDVPAAEDDAIPDEIPIAVVENETGFSVGEETYEAAFVNDDPPAAEQPVVMEKQKEPQPPSAAETIQQDIEAESEPIDVQWEQAEMSDQFKKTLLNHGKDHLGRQTVRTVTIYDEI